MSLIKQIINQIKNTEFEIEKTDSAMKININIPNRKKEMCRIVDNKDHSISFNTSLQI